MLANPMALFSWHTSVSQVRVGGTSNLDDLIGWGTQELMKDKETWLDIFHYLSKTVLISVLT